MWAYTFDHVVDGVHSVAIGQLDRWDLYRLEAECAVAAFAIEVCVHVLQCTLFFAIAHFISQHTVPVLDGVNHVVAGKKCQYPEYA